MRRALIPTDNSRYREGFARRAEVATVNGTIAALEVRLVKWMIGIVLSVASLQTAAAEVSILRLLG